MEVITGISEIGISGTNLTSRRSLDQIQKYVEKIGKKSERSIKDYAQLQRIKNMLPKQLESVVAPLRSAEDEIGMTGEEALEKTMGREMFEMAPQVAGKQASVKEVSKQIEAIKDSDAYQSALENFRFLQQEGIRSRTGTMEAAEHYGQDAIDELKRFREFRDQIESLQKQKYNTIRSVIRGEAKEVEQDLTQSVSDFLNIKYTKKQDIDKFVDTLAGGKDTKPLLRENIKKLGSLNVASKEGFGKAKETIRMMKETLNSASLDDETQKAYKAVVDTLDRNLKLTPIWEDLGRPDAGLGYFRRTYKDKELKDLFRARKTPGGLLSTGERSFRTLGDVELAQRQGAELVPDTTKEGLVKQAQSMKVYQERALRLHESYNDLINRVRAGQFGDAIRMGKPATGDYVKTGVPMLDNAEITMHKRVDDYFKGLHDYTIGNKDINAVTSALNKVMGQWKSWQTGAGVTVGKVPIPLNPAFTVRNKMNNVISGVVLGGVDPADMPVRQAQARKVWKYSRTLAKEGEEAAVKLGKETIGDKTVRQLYDEAKSTGLFSGTLQDEIRRMMGTGDEAGFGRVVREQLEKGGIKPSVNWLNERTEMTDKLAVFVDQRLGGETMWEARDKVAGSLFDYSELTPFERRIKPMFGFYTWAKKNLFAHMRLMRDNPDTMRIYADILESLRDVGEVPLDVREAMPEWMRERVAATWMGEDDEKMHGVYGFGTGLEGMADILGKTPAQTGRNVLSQLAPPFSAPIEVATGYNLFKEEPIEEDTSAYTYKDLPGPLRDVLGVREEKYETAEGETRTTYKMDPTSKYLLEKILGHPARLTAELSQMGAGEVNPLLEGLDISTGIKYQQRDVDWMKEQARRDELEQLQKQLVEMGIAQPMRGVYLSPNMERNYPELDQYLEQVWGYNPQERASKGETRRQEEQQQEYIESILGSS